MNIFEVAQRAAVSPAAVSRYFNNGSLSEEKKAAIEKVIEETGYRPSMHARYLRKQKTGNIGVIVPKIDSFSVANVVAGIDRVLEEKDYQLILADAHNSPERELEYLELFGENMVDGVILLGTIITGLHVEKLKESEIPVVVVGQEIKGIPSVYHDDYGAFRAITKLLLDKGRYQLGYIGAEHLDEAVGKQRREGFQDALSEAGLAQIGENMVTAEFSIASGHNKAAELLEKFGPLDGIVCATDTIAIGALKYLREAGLRVPEDIMVTGQGGADVCEAVNPTLTTIKYYYEKSGKLAAGMVTDLVEKPSKHVTSQKLEFSIKEHEST